MSDILGFEMVWFDSISGMTKTLYLKFFIDDNTLEIIQDKSAFLKRIYYPEVQIGDLFVGNSITVFNRLLTIKSYANVSTERYMQRREVRFACVIKGSNIDKVGTIFECAHLFDCRLGRVRTASHDGGDDTSLSIRPGDIIAELVGFGRINPAAVIERLAKLIGNNNIVERSYEDVTVSKLFSSIFHPEHNSP
jgi:hypothetical protein